MLACLCECEWAGTHRCHKGTEFLDDGVKGICEPLNMGAGN